MGRIITLDNGNTIHVGGRKQPAKPHPHRFAAGLVHGLALVRSRYGINLQNWPTTPTSTNYSNAQAAQECLRDVLGNDKVGDCTEANQFHLQALRQAAGGNMVFHPTLNQVLGIYGRDGGYDPNDPSTDQGCDENTVMQNAVQQGIPCDTIGSVDKPAGYIVVDATNRDLVRACVSMFVGASICMGLPDEWISPFPSSDGFVWDVPTGGFDPNNGHCFTLGDQNDSALDIWSWAFKGTLTYDALAAGCSNDNGGGLYIVVDREILESCAQQAPDGLDWAQLIADFNDAGGNVAA